MGVKIRSGLDGLTKLLFHTAVTVTSTAALGLVHVFVLVRIRTHFFQIPYR